MKRIAIIPARSGSKGLKNKNIIDVCGKPLMAYTIEDLLSRINCKINYFVLLQPTSPLRTEKHIQEAVDLFERQMDKYDFLVSVKEAEHGSVLVKPIKGDGSLKYFDTDFSNYRRQDYKEYSPNGAIFIGKPDQYLQKKHFFGEKSLAWHVWQMGPLPFTIWTEMRLRKSQRRSNGMQKQLKKQATSISC